MPIFCGFILWAPQGHGAAHFPWSGLQVHQSRVHKIDVNELITSLNLFLYNLVIQEMSHEGHIIKLLIIIMNYWFLFAFSLFGFWETKCSIEWVTGYGPGILSTRNADVFVARNVKYMALQAAIRCIYVCISFTTYLIRHYNYDDDYFTYKNLMMIKQKTKTILKWCLWVSKRGRRKRGFKWEREGEELGWRSKPTKALKFWKAAKTSSFLALTGLMVKEIQIEGPNCHQFKTSKC